MITIAVEKRFTCLDFFAGSGLVSLGLGNHFSTIWANDIAEDKQAVFNLNHDPSVFHLGSIVDVRGRDLPKAVLSWGSFPCQDLSLAGNIGGIHASRSGLFWQWARVMEEMKSKPPLAVAENVTGLLSTANGQNYLAVHNRLRELGYRVGAVVIDALHFVPQSRKRVFVIAVAEGINLDGMIADGPTWCHPDSIRKIAEQADDFVFWNLPAPPERATQLVDLIDWTAPVDNPETRDHLLSLIPAAKMRELRQIARTGCHVFAGYRRTRNHKQCLELRFDGIAGCLRTPAGGSSRQNLVLSWNGHVETRLLTLRETAALMGAPGYRFVGTYNDGYKAMGDAVAAPVAAFLSETILAPLAERATK